MTVLAFLNDKKTVLLTNIFLIVLYIGYMFFNKIPFTPTVTILVVWIGTLSTFMLVEFIKKHRYYSRVFQNLEQIDKKHLVIELIEETDFLDGNLVYDILKQTSKSMNDEINAYRLAEREYREYIETWVHEIKTPIASSLLIIENNKNPVTLSIQEELENMEQFIEQALYYAKSSSVEKDFFIKEVNLEEILKKVIKKNSTAFIHKHISIEMAIEEKIVYGDSKWLEFIINQMIINSIKYVKDRPCIKCYTRKEQACSILCIEDNGVGIPPEDLSKVFEKGFTGTNGRNFGKSTGMGLYIVKQLAYKMGIGIKIESEVNNYTKIQLVFPHNHYIQLT